VPAGASDQEIKKIVAEFVHAASMTHIARGGSGLKIDKLQVRERAIAPAGVPS